MKRKQKPKKQKINSRQKGAAGERELAHELARLGFASRRGQQFAGGTNSPDVVCEGLSDYHIECKRIEQGNLYGWLKQAIRDAGKKKPVVIHRRSREDWVAIVRLEDFLNLVGLQGLPPNG